MNPKSFLGIMSDISDEYIVSAANPHSKPVRWYQISAVAACIVLLIAVAVYPKLRTQKPAVVSSYTQDTTVAAESTGTTDNETTTVSSVSVHGSDPQRTDESTSTTATESTLSVCNTETSSVPRQTTTSQTESVQTTSHTTMQSTHSTEQSVTTDLTTVVQDETRETAEQASGQEQNVPFCIISERVVEASEEPLPYAAQSRLYRDFLPGEFAANLFPAVDFEKEDCLVIKFRSTGCGDGKAEEIGGTGMFYGIQIVPAAEPKDTVKEYVIAAVIPKALYSSASPNGINRWLCSDAPVQATDRMRCTLLRYDE